MFPPTDGYKKVSFGKYVGHQIEDVNDIYWSIGSSLPELFQGQEHGLKGLAIQTISQHWLNIEKLPCKLKHLVNLHHFKYGVRKIADTRYFATKCHNHSEDKPKKCRQCQARRDAWHLARLEEEGLHLNPGALVWDDRVRELELGIKLMTLAEGQTGNKRITKH